MKSDREQLEFVTRILRLMEHVNEWLCWRIDESDQIQFFINCNDVMVWACADGEDVTPENIHFLEDSFRDARAALPDLGSVYAPMLFCCRMAKMRPQGAAYPKHPELWPLFDACGPKREVGHGNPKPHPSEKQ